MLRNKSLYHLFAAFDMLKQPTCDAQRNGDRSYTNVPVVANMFVTTVKV